MIKQQMEKYCSMSDDFIVLENEQKNLDRFYTKKEILFKDESEKLQERLNKLSRDIDYLTSEGGTSTALKEKE